MKNVREFRLFSLRLMMGMSVWLLLFSGANAANKDTMKFQESASEMMIASLASQPKESFLAQLYRQLLYVPVWVTDNDISSTAKELFESIKEDQTLSHDTRLYMDALRLEEYAKGIYSKDISIKGKVDLEFKLSQLYKGYADYLLYGSINWGAFQANAYNLRSESIIANWVTNKPKTDPIMLLENAVFQGNLKARFADAEPKDYHYEALKASLINYLKIESQGGWGFVSFSGTINPGESHDVLPQIRERLKVSGEYSGCEEETTYYDDCLKEAVATFQKNHGLPTEGIIGKLTIDALNVPIQKRIAMIRLNLDRIKWLIQRETKRHIVINIPAFTLYFEEDKKLRQQMKVITGTRKNPTPVFSNVVQHIVLNPNWNVPKSIVQNEMIPKLLRNPNAMKKEGIEIYGGVDGSAKKIGAGSVDWSQYRHSKSLPFRFSQPPGEKNALGKVKFLFPNQYSVYMHDTPTKHLFGRDVRAFSHGCIRLEKPRELLQTFSTFNNTIDYAKAEKRLQGSAMEYLKLEEQVPVDVVYLTAWVNYDGVLQFRNDVYGYDEMQLSAIRQW